MSKSVVILSGSPKTEGSSVSDLLSSMQADCMKSEKMDVQCINVRNCISGNETDKAFSSMLNADALVIVFPLYIFCLPGILMRFLQDYYGYWSARKEEAVQKKRIYTVINCGFPEPGINEEAARVIESFSEKTNSIYRSALMIGGGGMLIGAKDAPFMRKMFEAIDDAFKTIAADIEASGTEPLRNKHVALTFPRKLYLFMGDRGWFSAAKKFGLKKKDLYRKPYLE